MNDYKNVYILSYKKNGSWNPVLNLSKKRFENQGFTPKAVEGYNLKKNPEIKRNEIVYLNFLDKIIPHIKSKNITDGFLFAEDDAYVSNIVTPEFLKRKIKANNGHKNIIRIGYQKVLAHTPKSTYPRGYFCVGNQLIWFPKGCIPHLEKIMKMKAPQHLNGFFSKDIELRKKGYDIILLDQDKQSGNKYNKYVREIEHISTTMERTRKGKRLSSIARNNQRRNNRTKTKKRKFLFI